MVRPPERLMTCPVMKPRVVAGQERHRTRDVVGLAEVLRMVH
jgi:hypothetical protein